MQTFNGSLRLPGEKGPGLGVTIDLTDETMRLNAAAGELATWRRREMRVIPLEDGFHIRAEGEEVILDITDDAEFAIALGLTSAPPLLRRKMSALLRER